MTQILISSPVPSNDGHASTRKSSTTTSVVALTPPTDVASLASNDSLDRNDPVQSVQSASQPPSVVSIDSFDHAFTWRSPSPAIPSVTDDRDVPVPSVELVPLAGLLASHESFNGAFAWRSPSPVAPSISLSSPPSTAASSRRAPTPRSHSRSVSVHSTAASRSPVMTPRSHSRSASVRSTAVDGDMSALRLSESGTSNRDTATSSFGPATPRTESVEAESIRFSEPSSPGRVTPRSTATPSLTSSPSQGGDMTPGAFDLASMQAALDQDVSRNPVTPRVSSDRQHLSPTPTPRASSARRRRSSSAIQQPRHEVSDEEPPENRFHQPEFQQAFRDAKQLMADLSDVLASNRLHDEPDSTMKRLYEDAKQLSDFTCPETRTVGFVGDSGVGKSSLINSLLDIESLARTSSSGAACTCVVTEYCYRSEPGFEIQVEYFSRDELEKQISELLESFRHFHLSFDDLSDDEIAVFEERAQVSEDTFKAMFRAQLQDWRELLDEDEEDVLLKLMSWVDNSPHSTTAKESLADAQSCSQRLMELTSDLASGDEAALWPFIRKIRVYCNAHILSRGLILVDLPGLRDINSARRGITERYIRDCDEIFAVCNIIRATTDEGVMAVIDLANKASLSNVGIICTRSDDIKAEEAKNDWKGELARTVQDIQNLVATAGQDLQRLEEELKDYDDIDPDDLFEEEKDAFIRLRRRVVEVKKVVVQREFELKSFLVRTRNDIVCQQLREAYEDRIPGDDLSVFCVSNVDYWIKRDFPRDISMDLLELSGMLEVRKHCISIVAESQLRAATLYMKRKIPALLESLQLWVQSGSGSLSAERKQDIRDTLDNVERILRRGLTDANSELNKPTIKRQFISFLAHYQHKGIWAQGAENAADEWSGWHHSSYAAFCRNFGCHSTRVAGTHNWNEEAIESMVGTLSPKWRELCAQIETQRGSATGALEQLCEEAIDILVQSQGQLDDDQIDILANSIRTQQSLLESKLDNSYAEVKKDLAKLKTDVLAGIQTSFMGQAMNSSYRACNRESGSGSDSRRKAIINRRLSGEGIFDEMEEQLRVHLRKLVEEFKSRLAHAARTHFQEMKENLDMLRDDNVILEAESDPEFRGKVDEEVRRVKSRLDRLLAGL